MEATALKRKQKIYYLYYKKLLKGEFYPMIRLAGKYLKRFNFNIGDQIEIDVTADKIEIRRVVPDNMPVKQEE